MKELMILNQEYLFRTRIRRIEEKMRTDRRLERHGINIGILNIDVTTLIEDNLFVSIKDQSIEG